MSEDKKTKDEELSKVSGGLANNSKPEGLADKRPSVDGLVNSKDKIGEVNANNSKNPMVNPY